MRPRLGIAETAAMSALETPAAVLPVLSAAPDLASKVSKNARVEVEPAFHCQRQTLALADKALIQAKSKAAPRQSVAPDLASKVWKKPVLTCGSQRDPTERSRSQLYSHTCQARPTTCCLALVDHEVSFHVLLSCTRGTCEARGRVGKDGHSIGHSCVAASCAHS